MFSYELLHMAPPVLDEQQKLIFMSSGGSGCHLEDLARAMADKMDGKRKSRESILAHLDGDEVCEIVVDYIVCISMLIELLMSHFCLKT